jgi:hypothetical protein
MNPRGSQLLQRQRSDVSEDRNFPFTQIVAVFEMTSQFLLNSVFGYSAPLNTGFMVGMTMKALRDDTRPAVMIAMRFGDRSNLIRQYTLLTVFV